MQAGSAKTSPLFQQRRAGVLLHPTSLPNSRSSSLSSTSHCGTLGPDAYQFVDFLAASGLTIWQMLPVGPTHSDRSPYQSLSAHAGSAELISIEWLLERDWINRSDVNNQNHQQLVRLAARNFFHLAQPGQGDEFPQNEVEKSEVVKCYLEFCENHAHWLKDFALFQTLRAHYKASAWNKWPSEYVQRDMAALETFANDYGEELRYFYFEQFVFYQQWQELRQYARRKGVFLFGDMPIFVAHDSADVWANQNLFNLDTEGNPRTVAGVPPDYFSETGQHWGNPHYDWAAMQATDFKWWLARLESQLQLFDLIRIDHFRGFEAYWEIPADSQDARKGRWVKAPGREFLQACYEAFPELPLVAENLGVITEEVEALRQEFHLPGMLVLQFGFDRHPDNPHLPHHHTERDLIYTGTHDNDTTLGWYQQMNEQDRHFLHEYYCGATDEMPWLLIKSALASVSRMAIVPLQDWLVLGSDHRMNLPGTTSKNWTWRFDWSQIPANFAEKIHHLLWLYDRLPEED